MVKLPDRNQELTEHGGARRCWLCEGRIDEEMEDWVWYDGRPAHEGCAWEAENPNPPW